MKNIHPSKKKIRQMFVTAHPFISSHILFAKKHAIIHQNIVKAAHVFMMFDRLCLHCLCSSPFCIQRITPLFLPTLLLPLLSADAKAAERELTS